MAGARTGELEIGAGALGTRVALVRSVTAVVLRVAPDFTTNWHSMTRNLNRNHVFIDTSLTTIVIH